MTPVFLDTVGLIAIWDKDDQWHAAAETAYQDITARRQAAVTTTVILLECGNHLGQVPLKAWSAELLAQSRQLFPNHQTCAVLFSGGHHPGILVVRRDNDPARTMSPGAIVHAINKLVSSRLQESGETRLFSAGFLPIL